jgi:hypothetical protein
LTTLSTVLDFAFPPKADVIAQIISSLKEAFKVFGLAIETLGRKIS